MFRNNSPKLFWYVQIALTFTQTPLLISTFWYVIIWYAKALFIYSDFYEIHATSIANLSNKYYVSFHPLISISGFDDSDVNYIVMSFNPKPVFLEWDVYAYSNLMCVKKWFESQQRINGQIFRGRDIVDLATCTCFCEAPLCGEASMKLVGLCPRPGASRPRRR